jgi:hypothetical protein
MVVKASGRIFKHYSAEPVLQKVAEASSPADFIFSRSA